MSIACPQCHSRRIGIKNNGRKTFSAIGIIVGGIGGAVSAISFTDFRGIDGSTRLALNILAGAILGGMLGGISGCATGASLGKAVDDNILNNFHCFACGSSFGGFISGWGASTLGMHDEGYYL